MLLHAVQHIQRLLIAAVCQKIDHCLHLRLFLRPAAIRTAVSGRTVSAKTALLLFFLHNLVICLLYFLKTLFSLLSVWIVDICIWVVFAAQGTICFLYFFIRCTGPDAQYVIRVSHAVQFPLYFLLHS